MSTVELLLLATFCACGLTPNSDREREQRNSTAGSTFIAAAVLSAHRRAHTCRSPRCSSGCSSGGAGRARWRSSTQAAARCYSAIIASRLARASCSAGAEGPLYLRRGGGDRKRIVPQPRLGRSNSAWMAACGVAHWHFYACRAVQQEQEVASATTTPPPPSPPTANALVQQLSQDVPLTSLPSSFVESCESVDNATFPGRSTPAFLVRSCGSQLYPRWQDRCVMHALPAAQRTLKEGTTKSQLPDGRTHRGHGRLHCSSTMLFQHGSPPGGEGGRCGRAGVR